jgi:hypothetical protein
MSVVRNKEDKMEQENIGSAIRLTGTVKLQVVDGAGKVVRESEGHNTMTTLFLGLIASAFNTTGSNPVSGFKYIAIGTGTTAAAAADTKLDTECTSGSWGTTGSAYGTSGNFTRLTGVVGVSGATYTCSGSFLNETAGTVTITEAGLFNSTTPASTGMGSRKVVLSTPCNAGERLYVIWVWAVQGV